MSKVIFDMSSSLDGFVKAAGTTPEEPLGRVGPMRIYAEWISPVRRGEDGGVRDQS